REFLSLSLKEKRSQSGGGLFGRFFGHVVARVDRAALAVLGPGAPDGQDVIPARQCPLGSPQRQDGAGDAATGLAVGLVEVEVERGAGAVVLTRGVDRRRVQVAAEVVG